MWSQILDLQLDFRDPITALEYLKYGDHAEGYQLVDLFAYKAWFLMTRGDFKCAEQLIDAIPAERFSLACRGLCRHYSDKKNGDAANGSLEDHKDVFSVMQPALNIVCNELGSRRLKGDQTTSWKPGCFVPPPD
ncbi:hypothetical protein CLAFUW4_04024 [Fulvia fulva]|nr:hypothetical protein CLAFUR4_04010 [Fulvia fulva]WPV13370.1 hypothetical protein CLAFUW4_04024 [Fulvia fulva]WPV28380.1 hypothetical protein CLAFUW7_04013 [Fulvia fulva]